VRGDDGARIAYILNGCGDGNMGGGLAVEGSWILIVSSYPCECTILVNKRIHYTSAFASHTSNTARKTALTQHAI